MARHSDDPIRPDDRVVIRDFLGMDMRADANDIPPGATTRQVNITGIRKGELRPRGGFRILKFEE